MKLMKFDRSNLSKQVVEVLRHQILSGAVKPNDRVCESEIAQSLGISRAPVREALVELEREGLTVTYPRRGTYVKSFTEKDIWEIYTLRALLEGQAGVLASDTFKQDDEKRLRDLIKAMGSSVDSAATSELNMQFHEEVFILANHQRLHRSWKSLYAQSRMLSTINVGLRTDISEKMAEHEVLVDVLIEGNENIIREIFEKHIIDSMDRLMCNLQSARKKPSSFVE